MNPQIDLPDLIEDYEANIDELEAALTPLLNSPLHTTASSLPLLDKAKLHVHAAYAIESMLYSTLLASGTDAKEHAVFKEIARLRTYIAKIKQVEGSAVMNEQPKMRLDTGAAARMINHGLAGNDKYDRLRQEKEMQQAARASAKLAMLMKKQKLEFDQKEEEEKQVELAKKADEAKKRKAADLEDDDDDEDEEDEADSSTSNPAAASTPSSTQTTPHASKKDKKREKKLQKLASASATATSTDESTPDPKTKKRRNKRQKKDPELLLPAKTQTAPKSHSQAFTALLNGSSASSAAAKEGKTPKKGKK